MSARAGQHGVALRCVRCGKQSDIADDLYVCPNAGCGANLLVEYDLDAVIDKDLATSLLAAELKADLLIISTAVEKVSINFKKPNQQDLDTITLAEAKQYLAEGHFAPGSMKPKIQAVIEFLEGGGKEAIITDPPHLVEAVEGKTGTRIVA